MDEILQKLLESELLTEETKTEISAKFKTAVGNYLTEERSKLEVEIQSSLTEEFVNARKELVEVTESTIDKFLSDELSELKEDIDRFRDLEVEYAEMLIEEKEKLADAMASQVSLISEALDAFIDQQIDEEIQELKEDIITVKKLNFGRKIFEAVESEYQALQSKDKSSIEHELARTKAKLTEAENKLIRVNQEYIAEAKENKIEELLAPLSGKAREQMELVLSNKSVTLERLDDTFNRYINKILKESKPEVSNVQSLTEAKEKKSGRFITGNDKDTDIDEQVSQPTKSQLTESVQRMRLLAGLN